MQGLYGDMHLYFSIFQKVLPCAPFSVFSFSLFNTVKVQTLASSYFFQYIKIKRIGNQEK